MAKLFYSLEEAAQALGISEEQVRQLGASGKLQVFRDRDKVMFKRDKIETLIDSETIAEIKAADAGPDDATPDDSGLSGTGSGVPLEDSGTGSGMDLADDSGVTDAAMDSGQGSGINIFEADEVDTADPMAQTRVTQAADDEELALESVGSGSGLLDLTRESDDSSLGAELIEEIQLSDTAADSKVGSLPGASGSFETGLELEASASGLEHLQTAGDLPAGVVIAEPYDATWSGLSTGLLLGATACLVIVLIVAIYGVAGVSSSLTTTFAESGWLYLILVIGSVAFGVAGMFIARMNDR
jgi:preprotein translocase subunit SecD